MVTMLIYRNHLFVIKVMLVVHRERFVVGKLFAHFFALLGLVLLFLRASQRHLTPHTVAKVRRGWIAGRIIASGLHLLVLFGCLLDAGLDQSTDHRFLPWIGGEVFLGERDQFVRPQQVTVLVDDVVLAAHALSGTDVLLFGLVHLFAIEHIDRVHSTGRAFGLGSNLHEALLLGLTEFVHVFAVQVVAALVPVVALALVIGHLRRGSLEAVHHGRSILAVQNFLQDQFICWGKVSLVEVKIWHV